jgi:hypothetical protein
MQRFDASSSFRGPGDQENLSVLLTDASTQVMIIVCDILTTILVKKLNLGQHISVLAKDDPTELTLTLSSRATVTITALTWTKTAFAVTLLRLTDGATKKFIWFIIISMNIAMMIGAMVPWVQCIPLAKGWDRTLEGACWGPTVGVNIWIVTGGTFRFQRTEAL